MKKKYFKINCRSSFYALVIFCSLMTNLSFGQDTFVWNGSVSNNWATAGNWTKTGSASSDTFPGQTAGRVLDFVAIENGGNVNVASGTYGMLKLTITNATGPATGSTLTIASGAVITVVGPGNTTAEVVLLRGGNLVNNGTLNATGTLTTGTNNNAAYGITCGLPVVIPANPTEYGYSGSGTLNINTSAGNQFSGGIIVNSIDLVEANARKITYKLIFGGTTNFSLSTSIIGGSQAIRVINNGANFPGSVIIGGAGFTLGSPTAGVSNGLIAQSGVGTNITINAGTTLTIYGNNTNANNMISYYGYGTGAGNASLINKGTLNVFGTTARSAFTFSCEWNATMTFDNQGTVNVDFISLGANQAGILLPIQGTQNTAAGANVSTVTILNSGTINLKNQLSGANAGTALLVSNDPKTPGLIFNNTGTLNLVGANFNLGGNSTRSLLTNSGTIVTNQELRAFGTTNEATGVITFTNTGASATLKLASFTVANTIAVTLGATYTDANLNVHTVVATKVAGTGTSVSTTVAYAASVPGLGSLTKVTGLGDTAVPYSALAIINRNALNSFTTNRGVINTTTGPSYLNGISGVINEGAAAVISPGGSNGRGIAINNSVVEPTILVGTIKIQVSGNTTAGVDYDQYISTGQVGGFDVNGAVLDVTGIYTPTAATTIDIMTTLVDVDPNLSGALIGNFSSVVGLTPGWSVNYIIGLGGKVQLVFNPNLSIGSTDFANFKFNVYPNPATSNVNISADRNIDSVALYNYLGQKVFSSNVNALQQRIDVSNLDNGIYFMDVTIENTKKAFKIIKK